MAALKQTFVNCPKVTQIADDGADARSIITSFKCFVRLLFLFVGPNVTAQFNSSHLTKQKNEIMQCATLKTRSVWFTSCSWVEQLGLHGNGPRSESWSRGFVLHQLWSLTISADHGVRENAPGFASDGLIVVYTRVFRLHSAEVLLFAPVVPRIRFKSHF